MQALSASAAHRSKSTNSRFLRLTGDALLEGSRALWGGTADARVVAAWLTDWPRDLEEERRSLEASRAAVEAVSQRVLRGRRSTPP